MAHTQADSAADSGADSRAHTGGQGLSIAAKKSLGQNFLVDRHYLAEIVAAAALEPGDQVLEIGPGKGVLTQELAAHAGRVIAVELDDRLIEPLRATFAAQPQVQIVHGDILALDPPTLFAGELGQAAGAQTLAYKVVANLPYYITSAVLRQLLESTPPPVRVVVLVQWEVAQRICAQPGDLSILAVSVQYYARPQLVCRVPAGAFRPIPKVDSAVLLLDVLPEPAAAIEAERFFAVVRAGFSQKRKQLLNSLSAGLQRPKADVTAALACAHIEPMRRAETLALTEWEALCRCL